MRLHLHVPDETEERLSRPAAISLACHAGLFALIVLWGFIAPQPFQFGDPDGEGGAARVNIVNGIPLAVPRTRENPVANPTTHEVQAPQEKPPTAAPEPDPEPEALPVEQPERKVGPTPQEHAIQQRTEEKPKENQVTSTQGRQVSSPLFSESQSGAGVGFQGANPFGQGYGWYAEALSRRLSEEWGKTLGQTSGTTDNAVVVRFRIHRNGRVDQVRVYESSGNRSIDYSAHRAVLNINPFQRLPPALRRPYIVVEMSFQLRS